MKWFSAFLICWSLAVSTGFAQVDFPGNPMVGPKKYTTRPVGGGVDTGTSVEEGNKATARYVTHLILYQSRWWTSAEGKPLEAKLIAFEDLVAEVPKGSAVPGLPEAPAHPTVVRDGKIRLLVNGKAIEVSLDRFTPADQEFVGQIKTAIDKKAEGH